MLSRADRGEPKNYHSNEELHSSRVYLGGLDLDWKEKEIHQFMSQYGSIVEVSIARSANRESRGYGFVTYSTIAEARAACGVVHYKYKSVAVKPARTTNKQAKAHYGNYLLEPEKKPKMRVAHEQPNPKTRKQKNLSASTMGMTPEPSPVPSSNEIEKFSLIAKSKEQAENLQRHQGKLEQIALIENTLRFQPNTSEQMLISSPKLQSKISQERVGLISKLSQEFHPKPLYFTEMVPQLSNPATHAPSYDQNVTQFQPFSTMASWSPEEYIMNGQMFGSRHIPPIIPEQEIIIKFYTFPGRE